MAPAVAHADEPVAGAAGDPPAPAPVAQPPTVVEPNADALLNGEVPPLTELPKHRTVLDVIQKVRRGAPVIMGRAAFPYRGRMPVFDYLTDDEVAAAYMYLLAYPPRSTRLSPRDDM